MSLSWRPLRGLLCVSLLAGGLLLGGCAATAVQRNLDDVRTFSSREFGVETRLNATRDAHEAAGLRARQLLAEPLTLDTAVEVALTFSPVFQQTLADSAAASAAATQSARPRNPIFDYGRLSAGRIVEIDRAVTVSLLDFLLLPQRRRLADLQQAQHRLRSAGDVVNTIVEVRQAWIDAVAAAQSASYAERVQASAAAAADLGRRMAAVGNFARIEWAREQVYYADATTELARARLDATTKREALVRLLGLTGELEAALRLPDRLPVLPADPMSDAALAERAFADRLDVRLARAELEFTARSLGLTRVTSTVNALDIAGRNQGNTGEDTREGYEIQFSLPLFDFGDARRANAQAVYLSALNRTAQVTADAYSHVRESYAAYRTAFDVARHYRDEVIPLRQVIAEENWLRYNGMLISVFELLADAREQATSVRQAIAAQADYWKSDVALRASLIGRPIESIALGSPSIAPGSGATTPH